MNWCLVFSNKNIKFIFVIFTSLIMISCEKNNFGPYTRSIEKIIGRNFTQRSLKTIIIIPNEGCGGCISDATFFVKTNIESLKDDTIIIFTGVDDFKQLRLVVGTDFLKEKNVFIDSANVLMQQKVASIYPQILKVSNKKIYKVDTFDKNVFLNLNK